MTLRTMEQGIAAVQQGRYDEGARLLRIALRSPDLQGPLRATACVWLAHTIQDQQERIQLYKEALQADPQNEHAQRRLSQLYGDSFPTDSAPPMPPSGVPGAPGRSQPPDQADWPLPQMDPDDLLARNPPPTPANYGNSNLSGNDFPPDTGRYDPFAPINDYAGLPQDMGGGGPYNPPTEPAPPIQLHNSQVVAVLDGPNGTGSGFFVSKRGVVATTRFVVRELEQVRIDLGQGQIVPGKVARSYPQWDLAFIETGVRLNELMPVARQEAIPPRMPLRAVMFPDYQMAGERRDTVDQLPRGWFPTTISNPRGAGGNPVFDRDNFLVGMLTRNTARRHTFVHGLNIYAIGHFLQTYEQERNARKPPVYCPTCGGLAQAHNADGYYCEYCGAVLAPARQIQRFARPLRAETVAAYGESQNVPCRHCRARVGYYNNKCLRCGQDQ